MAITNLNNTHLSEAQLTEAKEALTSLENALAVIQVNLTAEDRMKYGSINEQNKLLVNKVYDYFVGLSYNLTSKQKGLIKSANKH